MGGGEGKVCSLEEVAEIEISEKKERKKQWKLEKRHFTPLSLLLPMEAAASMFCWNVNAEVAGVEKEIQSDGYR